MSRVVIADIGNQRLKWAVLEVVPGLTVSDILDLIENQIDSSNSIDIDLNQDSRAQFTQLTGNVVEPDHILYSCVGNATTCNAFSQVCLRAWGIVPQKIYSEEKRSGLKNCYDNYSQLGADRWLAALAAFHIVSKPAAARHNAVIVIDAGTAITVDLVAGSEYKGGAILPGLALLFGALGNSTGEIRIDTSSLVKASANLNEIDVIATNSDAAVNAGVMVSVIGGIERCVAQMHKVCQAPARILITGGDAELVSTLVKCQSAVAPNVVPNLVLAGLALVAVEILT